MTTGRKLELLTKASNRRTEAVDVIDASRLPRSSTNKMRAEYSEWSFAFYSAARKVAYENVVQKAAR